MKKKSLNAKKKIHRNLIKLLKIKRINTNYKIFCKNIGVLKSSLNIAAAVSGGPDSLALAFFLKCYSIKNGQKVYFYHINHKLRPSSKKESKILKRKLNQFDINCKIIDWNGKKPKSNIQSMARNARYSLILKECKKNKVNNLFLAHHIDDLYENFFIRMLRGSGLRGLASFNNIKSNFTDKISILRPLLSVQKSELIFTSKKVFNFYFEDPSNENDIFKRVRIRKFISKLNEEGLDLKKMHLTLKNLSDSNNTINFYVENNISKNATKVNKSKFILSEDFFKSHNEIVFRSLSKI